MNLNKVMLIGNLTRDPELRQTKSGINVSSFSIATNRKWTAKDGTKQEEVEFHNIVAWAKTAELITQYMKKGSGIFIEGRLQTRTYEKDGIKRYSTEVVVENMQFGNKPQNTGQVEQEAPPEPTGPPPSKVNTEDIPF